MASTKQCKGLEKPNIHVTVTSSPMRQIAVILDQEQEDIDTLLAMASMEQLKELEKTNARVTVASLPMPSALPMPMNSTNATFTGCTINFTHHSCKSFVYTSITGCLSTQHCTVMIGCMWEPHS